MARRSGERWRRIAPHRIVQAYAGFLMPCRATFIGRFHGIACRLLPFLYGTDNYRDAVAAVAMGRFEYRVTRFESGFLRVDRRSCTLFLFPTFDNLRHRRCRAIQPSINAGTSSPPDLKEIGCKGVPRLLTLISPLSAHKGQ